MMAKERTRRTVFPLTGRPSYAYMAAWEDEVSTKKVMNLKLGVTPKTIQKEEDMVRGLLSAENIL